MKLLKAIKEALILTGITLLLTALIVVGIVGGLYLLEPLVGNLLAGIITIVVMSFLIILLVVLANQ